MQPLNDQLVEFDHGFEVSESHFLGADSVV